MKHIKCLIRLNHIENFNMYPVTGDRNLKKMNRDVSRNSYFTFFCVCGSRLHTVHISTVGADWCTLKSSSPSEFISRLTPYCQLGSTWLQGSCAAARCTWDGISYTFLFPYYLWVSYNH